ncbi:MAG: hypothetical protein AUK03_00855 [Anaerolineae bacterium CG2_30_64_16]|nr:MAG: hypothetical protein AUK03_00855 [Anaerolineae bacterium CG2_30_64_16]
MRASDYTIIVDLPEDGQSLLVHGYTGAFDVVQPQVAEFLREMCAPDTRFDAPSTISPDSLATLQHRGYLTDMTPAQEQTHVLRLAEILQKRHRRQSPSFLVIPTYDCNLRCTYCYEKLLRRNGRAWLETRMTPDQVDAAYAAMRELQAQAAHQPRVRAITLYGGEPLLAGNRELIEYIVARGRAAGYVFGAITNGVELDQFLHLVGPDSLRTLQITLDGPPEVHDRRRVRADGSGSFDAIQANIGAALAAGAEVSVRMNVDRKNMAVMKTLSRLIDEYGWSQRKNFSAYISAVHDAHYGNPANELLIGELQAAYLCELPTHPELHRIMDPARVLQKQLGETLFAHGFPPFRPSFCGSNAGMYLFDPFGDLYPCWDVVGRAEYKIGSFFPGGLRLDSDALDPWLTRTITQIPECRTCPYALFCGGGCTSQAHQTYGRFDAPVCHDFVEQFHLILPALYRQRMAQADQDRDADTEPLH